MNEVRIHLNRIKRFRISVIAFLFLSSHESSAAELRRALIPSQGWNQRREEHEEKQSNSEINSKMTRYLRVISIK